MPDQSRKFPHIYLPENGESENYTTPKGGGDELDPPNRDRASHAKDLENSIGLALQKAKAQLKSREPEIATGEPGFYLEFQMQADKSNAFESLQNRQKKIELVAVKKIPDQEDMLLATVFVPEKSSGYFLDKVEQYRKEDTKKGKPLNEKLVSRIEAVDLGEVKSLFTDPPALFPQDGQEVWWEIWLRNEKRNLFANTAKKLDIPIKDYQITFPEREVILAMADVALMARVIKNSDAIAELRIAKDTPSFFLEMGPCEQEAWAEALSEQLLEPGEHAVSICLLDSGITRRHLLLSMGLAPNDMHTVEPSWGVDDRGSQWRGHGTAMAGIALYSDLLETLQTSRPIKLLHRLESVKILPNSGQNDPDLYGAITEQAVSLSEIQAPDRHRVFCMAVTSDAGPPNIGIPSSWSAAVDQLCFNDGESRRLIIISTGNIFQNISKNDYLSINDLEAVENPAQAWNALIVGAYTEKVNILDPTYAGWTPLASSGDLSPRSRTSVSWATGWPIRPDVVFEGGNMAFDGDDPAVDIDDLNLLTTHYQPNTRMFDYMRDTSCATALASHMAARIMSEHPTYNPETVRALIVHSAEWTPAMLTHFEKASNKTLKRSLVRRYGYGVPSLERALQSAINDLTLITEDEIQPFCLAKTRVSTKDMNLHKLPWPREKLEELGEASVELKITLSYFIEPNPGERGWAYKHRYASHGLRFKVKGALESDDDFKWRINKVVREEQGKRTIPDSSEEENWELGPNTRNCGSLHCDIWKGTAADLAQKDAVAVFPVGGGWKDKKYLNKYDQTVQYSLIISIRVPDIEVDIYTPVSNLVKTTLPTAI